MIEALSVRIRPLRKTDLPALEWDGEYKHYRRVYKRALQEAEKGRRVILVAESGDQIVGQIFVILNFNLPAFTNGTPSGFLYAFRVRPEFRNQGIGKRLIHEAEAALKARGYQRAIISAALDNPDARRLYERLGYATFTQDQGLWFYVDDEGRLRQVHEPANIMEKTFNAVLNSPRPDSV